MCMCAGVCIYVCVCVRACDAICMCIMISLGILLLLLHACLSLVVVINDNLSKVSHKAPTLGTLYHHIFMGIWLELC